MSPDWRRRRRREEKKKWSSYCSYIKFQEKSLIDCSIRCSLLRSVTVAKRWYTLITYAWSYPHSVAGSRIFCCCLFLNISFLHRSGWELYVSYWHTMYWYGHHEQEMCQNHMMCGENVIQWKWVTIIGNHWKLCLEDRNNRCPRLFQMSLLRNQSLCPLLYYTLIPKLKVKGFPPTNKVK